MADRWRIDGGSMRIDEDRWQIDGRSMRIDMDRQGSTADQWQIDEDRWQIDGGSTWIDEDRRGSMADRCGSTWIDADRRGSIDMCTCSCAHVYTHACITVLHEDHQQLAREEN